MNTHEIVTAILKREGWDKYTNYPNDRGGPTKWGITQKAWSGFLGKPATIADVQGITETQARNFYYLEYIGGPSFDKITDDFLAELIIDCGVNHGTHRAGKWLQAAASVPVDGAVGPKTLAAANSQPGMKLALLVIAERIRFYATIASDQLPLDPDLPNLRGWMNRATSFLTAAAGTVK